MAKIKLKTGATIEETFQDSIISRRAKGLKEKTIESYQNHFHAVARHLDVEMDIDMLQKSDLDRMIVSMRDAELSANSINSYTRTLKSFFSWCNEEGIGRLVDGRFAEELLLPPIFFLVDKPVPGIPALTYVPRLPEVRDNPFTPVVILTPDFDKLSLTPLHIFIDFRYRIFSSSFFHFSK